MPCGASFSISLHQFEASMFFVTQLQSFQKKEDLTALCDNDQLS